VSWSVVLAAIITLVGGVFVYRWQREIDRLTELGKERRDTYRSFICALDDYMLVFFGGDDEEKLKAFSRYRVAKRHVILIGSSWVLRAIEQHGRALTECERVMNGTKEGLMERVNEGIRKSEDKIIIEMRNDFAYGTNIGLSDILPLPREKRQ
jgi:hypothetical protein